jgi:hypothetical protein
LSPQSKNCRHDNALLVLKKENPEEYESKIRFGERYTAKWDEPDTLRGRHPGVA